MIRVLRDLGVLVISVADEVAVEVGAQTACTCSALSVEDGLNYDKV